MWKRLANTDTAGPLTTTTNCCERKMLFAWLWCPCRGPLKSPPITIWTTQCSFCLQPFSLLLKWRWKPTGEEIKSLKRKKQQNSHVEMRNRIGWHWQQQLMYTEAFARFFFFGDPRLPSISWGLEWPPPAFREGAALAMSDCCRAA